MSKKFQIFEAGDKTDSHDLVGLEIEETADGYQLVVPRQVLATASLVRVEPGKPLLTFRFRNYKGWDWEVKVDSSSEERMQGTWKNNDDKHVNPTEEGDSWTASGTGADPTDADARAAYGK